MRLLLAEDEHELSRALTVILEHNGYTVDVACDGEEALYHLGINDYDLVILDIMMPKIDGLAVLQRLRVSGSTVSVLLLTAKSEIDDRVAGLDAGANDYLTKPFSARELLARIRALTHTSPGMIKNELVFGDLLLDKAKSRVVCGKVSEDLTNREYQMLEMLITAHGAKISTDQFLRRIWGGLTNVETNVVWVNLSNLRKNLSA